MVLFGLALVLCLTTYSLLLRRGVPRYTCPGNRTIAAHRTKDEPALRVGLMVGGGSFKVIYAARALNALQALSPLPLDVRYAHGTSSGALLAPYAVAGKVRSFEDAFFSSEAAFGDHWMPWWVPCRELWAQLAMLVWGAMFRRVDLSHMITMIKGLSPALRASVFCRTTSTSFNLSRRQAAVHHNARDLRALLDGVEASCAAPGLVPAVPMGGDLHIDGALVERLPSKALRLTSEPVDLVLLLYHDESIHDPPVRFANLFSRMLESLSAGIGAEQTEDLSEVRAHLRARRQPFAELASRVRLKWPLRWPSQKEVDLLAASAEDDVEALVRGNVFRAACERARARSRRGW
jgi:predicted acylesterase/phospholipase RssA